MTFDLGKPAGDTRAFELINKTNQFNLNGKRYDEAAWLRLVEDPRTCVITVSYEDKFGKLGRIAVMIGRVEEGTFIVESWVMSCRAFSRRIEFHCAKYLFDRFGAEEIVLQVQATGRNGPLIEFVQQFVDRAPETDPRVTRSVFRTKAPKLPHHVEEVYASK